MTAIFVYAIFIHVPFETGCSLINCNETYELLNTSKYNFLGTLLVLKFYIVLSDIKQTFVLKKICKYLSIRHAFTTKTVAEKVLRKEHAVFNGRQRPSFSVRKIN